MERLELTSGNAYSALESSIRISRYLLARRLCAGKKVLDIACGEGHGTCLMERWGATSVAGLDNSKEAITRARANFSKDNVRFTVGDADRLADYYEDHAFDLIVSLQTIEHLCDPTSFLQAVKRVLSPGGTVIVGCPNDHWYYENLEADPFPKRKFRFDEFRQITENVLGPAQWYLGCLAAGYTTVPLDELGAPGGPDPMMDISDSPDSVLLPGEPALAPTPDQSPFFVGLWGPGKPGSGAAVVPYSLKAFSQGVFAGPDAAKLRIDAERWRKKFQDCAQENVLLKKQQPDSRELKRWRLAATAVNRENALLRERLATVSWRVQGIYRHVRAVTPLFVLRSGARLVDLIRRMRHPG